MIENFLIVCNGEPVNHSQQVHPSTCPLSEKGVDQAVKTGSFFNEYFFGKKHMYFEKMFYSADVKSMQTAARLDLIRAEWKFDSRLNERDMGEPADVMSSNVVARVHGFIDSLSSVDGGNVIVVCSREVAVYIRMILFGYMPEAYKKIMFSLDENIRIAHCQIDHYTRIDPKTLKLSDGLKWFKYYRPSEGGPSDEIYPSWSNIKPRFFSSSELLTQANKLSGDFVQPERFMITDD